MDVLLRDLTGTECWNFIDDLILFSDTIEEHVRRLVHVLQRFEKANLQQQPEVCIRAIAGTVSGIRSVAGRHHSLPRQGRSSAEVPRA
jgi:hypothetical protein